jgi:hypothetical protein
MIKRSRPKILLATTLIFTHDTSIHISYWRLLTELHAVLHRLRNIKHTLISSGVCHLDQMEKVEIRAVIKYLCKKGMSPKDMKTSWIHLGRSPFPIALWKKWAANFRGAERALEMMNGLGGQKRPPTMKLPKLCTIWSCAIEGETCKANLGKWV